MAKAKRKIAKKLSPDSPEARDEGPRLIPLNLQRADHTWGQYALQLADIALGLDEASLQKKRPKSKKAR